MKAKKIVNWNHLFEHELICINLCGNESHKINTICDKDTSNIYFEDNGQIVGELLQNGRVNWYYKTTSFVSNGIRRFVKSCINESLN